MPVKRTSNTAKVIAKIESVGEQCMTQILAVILANSKFYVPIDTSALSNSDFRSVEQTATGWRGRVGYTAAYAAALHERTDWQPRPPGSPGKKGGGYNPNATPAFLERGAAESRDEIQRIIRANYGSI